MKILSARFYVLIFLVLCNYGHFVFAAEILETPINVQAYLKYAKSKFVSKYKLKVLKAFVWTVGRDKGILLTAQPPDSQGSEECLILSEKNGEVKLVGASKLLHKCKWISKQPIRIEKANLVSFRFYNEVDISGNELEYSTDYIELFFKSATKEFCTMDSYSHVNSKCKIF